MEDKNTPEKVIANTEVGMVVKGYGGLFHVISVNRQTFEVKIEPISTGRYGNSDRVYEEYDVKDENWYK